MKTVTHTLTAFDGVYEKTIYNVGPAKVVINTDDFYTDTNTRYYKLHTQVDTGKITVYTLDLGADNSSLSGRQIETNVYPSSAYHTTRTVYISGYKFVGEVDVFKVNLKLRQSDLLDEYGELNLLNVDLYSATTQKNNALLTLQSSKTREVFNIVVPFPDNLTTTTTVDPEVITIDISVLDILRTEQFSDVGSLQPITTENGDFIARRIKFDGEVYIALESSIFAFNDNDRQEHAIITERTALDDFDNEVEIIVIPEDGYQPDEGTIQEVGY